jgi:hypothetical protein
MISLKHSKEYWTKDVCLNIALKYKSKKEFIKKF